MSFDIKTVFTLFFMADIALVMFLYLYRVLININAYRFNLYILGKFLQAISILFFALIREQVAYPVAILAGNIPAIFGIALETYSFSVFGGTQIKNKLKLFAIIAVVLAVIFGVNLYSSLHIRVFLVFVSYSTFFVLSGIIVMRSKPLSKLKLSTGILLLVIALFGIYRLVDAIIVSEHANTFNNQVSEVLSFLVFFLISFVLTINFIFLFKEEDENTIKEGERNLKAILNAFPDEVFVVNKNKEIIFSNNKITTNNKQPKTCAESFQNKEVCANCMIQKLNVNNSLLRNEYYNPTTDEYFDSTHILLDEENCLTIRKNITDKKKADQRLKMLSDIVEQSPASIVVTNLEGNLEYVNKAFCDTTGYSFEEAIGENPRILQSDFVNKEGYIELWDKLTNGQTWQGEFVNKTKSGEIYYEEALIAPTYDAEGNIVNYFGIKHNITDKKMAENALRTSQENLVKAQAVAKIGHWSLDILNNKLKWSDEVYRIFELNKQEFKPNYKDFLEFIHPDDQGVVEKEFKESIANKTKYEITHRILLKNGKIKYVNEQCYTKYTEKGIPYSSIGTVQDVTEKEEANKLIKENEIALDQFFKVNPIPVAVLNFDTNDYVRVNKAYADFVKLPPEKIIGKTPADIKIISKDRMHALKQMLEEYGRVEHEKGILTDNEGKAYDVITYAEMINLKGKQMVYTTSIDLTELNAAKEKLEISNKKLTQALDDKNVLLKEVHHRVKNNFQTIGSLLFKQQRISSDNGVKMILQDSIDRIASIALINEQIYRSENFREIDLSKHIHEIASSLHVAYEQAETKITIAEHTEPVMLSVEKAIPCSLVINEIISNSFKHGFKNKTIGNITIELKNVEDSSVSLIIEDDGVGLPDGFSHEQSKSLGMFIIFNLAKRQLFSDIELTSEQGTKFTLKFKK